MATNDSGKKSNGDSKSAGGILGKQFQKMRRRLTVTGASSTIDGSVKPGIEPSGDLKIQGNQRFALQGFERNHGISRNLQEGTRSLQSAKEEPGFLDYERGTQHK